MKKSKILSFMLVLAMVLSFVPMVMVSADSSVIYSEDFDGETKEGLKSQGYTLKDDESRIEIADNKVVAKTSVGGSGFNFNFLSAEAKGLVRVKYDVKLSHNGYDVNKSALKTDAGDIPLIFFSAYGTISQDYDLNSWTATLNEVEGVKYWTHWYNVDLLLDFDNNTITVNLKNLDDGSMAISDLVWNYDLSGVNTIKGFDTYGWTHGNVADTGYDNLLIEYVERPDPNIIYSEDFDGETKDGLKAQGYTLKDDESRIEIADNKVWNYDLSGINTIKGFHTYGWTHGDVADTGYDNLLIEYVERPDPNTIYSENFNGKTTADLKSQGYTIEGGDNLIVIENDKVVAKTSEGGVGFNFNFLSAEAKGLVRVKYDVNLYNASFDVNKSKLFTDGADIPLIAFGAYGSISQDYDNTTWTATLNKVEGVGYGTHWYNVDLLLDFDNNTITVNMENLDDGSMAISDHVWNYDLSGINTIKGFHTYGWTHGDVADTGYDNLLIEYVERPDPNAIYSENFDGKVLTDVATLNGTGCSIVDDAATGNPNGDGGFIFKNLNAKVADAPLGKIRFKFDIYSHDPGAAATTIALTANTGEIPLISYGLWASLRVTAQGDVLSGFAVNEWNVNDIVLDFTNNKIIYNVATKNGGVVALDNYERDVDLSSVTSIDEFNFWSWAGAVKLDNLVIEYVTEETPDTPDEPDVPVLEGTIYEENFDGKTKEDLKSQGYTLKDDDSRIELADNKVVAKTSVGGSGFNFNFLSAEAKGLVRVKYDVNLYNNAFDVNKSKLITDGADIPLIFFGAYGSISQDYDTGSWTATLNKVEGVGYGTHWYNVDLLLDFDNNTITVNLKNLDTDSMAISDLVWNYDLSGINTIKGFDTYGWTHGDVVDTGYDNLLIEYVTEETPDEPEFKPEILSENFDGKELSDIATIEGTGIGIVDDAATGNPTNGTPAGFTLGNLNAKIADAPIGKIRVKFDFSSPDTQAGATTINLLTNTGEVRL
ncbi:MAG: hypothetical protein E7417_04125, partial [Ruminococcaceae bacterium]|nr:hypothetical protein [Oscillospiraceae bacterium]